MSKLILQSAVNNFSQIDNSIPNSIINGDARDISDALDEYNYFYFYTPFYGNVFKSSPKKCVNCSQLKMILSCRLLGHLFDDLFMIVVVGKHIEHTAACAPFIMLIDQD